MPKINIKKENKLARAGIADTRFADHSGQIQQGYQLGSLTEGLLAYYPMEEGQGQVLHDAALDKLGQINGATWNGSGKVGSDSLSFNGTSDNVNLGKNIFPNFKQGITLCGWFYFDSLADSDTDRLIDIEAAAYLEASPNGSGDIKLGLYNGSSTSTLLSSDATDDAWNHIMGHWNSSTMSIWINGTQSVSQSFSGPVKLEALNRGSSIGSARGGSSAFFDGRADDVRIYDRGLSQPEIQALYNLTSSSGHQITEKNVPTKSYDRYGNRVGGAVSRYRFNGDVIDSWGSNDGIDNTSAGFVDGVYGKAKDFDGKDDYVQTSHFSQFTSYTISQWTKHDSVGDGDQDSIISLRANNGILLKGTGGSKFKFSHQDANGTFQPLTASISNGVWNHWVAVWDGSIIRLFKNSNLMAEKSANGMKSLDSAEDVIGAEYAGGYVHFFDGALEDMRIYSEALSSSKIKKLFNKGTYRINRGDI